MIQSGGNRSTPNLSDGTSACPAKRPADGDVGAPRGRSSQKPALPDVGAPELFQSGQGEGFFHAFCDSDGVIIEVFLCF